MSDFEVEEPCRSYAIRELLDGNHFSEAWKQLSDYGHSCIFSCEDKPTPDLVCTESDVDSIRWATPNKVAVTLNMVRFSCDSVRVNSKRVNVQSSGSDGVFVVFDEPNVELHIDLSEYIDYPPADSDDEAVRGHIHFILPKLGDVWQKLTPTDVEEFKYYLPQNYFVAMSRTDGDWDVYFAQGCNQFGGFEFHLGDGGVIIPDDVEYYVNLGKSRITRRAHHIVQDKRRK